MSNAIDQEKRNAILQANLYDEKRFQIHNLIQLLRLRKVYSETFLRNENELEEEICYLSIQHINDNIKKILGL